MVEGRSKQAFKTWLAERPEAWRDGIEVVAMDGFTGFKTATAEEMPDAVAVMDPFHVVRLAGDALDRCRRRVQLAIHGHRGHKDDPLYSARRTLHTGADLLTDKQKDRLDALFAADAHVEVEATWGIYQRMVAAYRHPDRAKGRELMVKLIDSISHRRPRRAHRDHHPRADPEEARRRRPGLLRPARHQQRTDRSDQRTTRTPPRLRTRLPQPHQLHRTIAARDRRVQTAATPWIVKSRFRLRWEGSRPSRMRGLLPLPITRTSTMSEPTSCCRRAGPGSASVATGAGRPGLAACERG